MAASVPNLRGRIAVVTGGTSGLGLEVVKGLATLGARVVIAGRGGPRVDQVAEQVRRSTGQDLVEGVAVEDLALRSSWPALASELERRLPALHILVNNAGGLFMRREVTADGFERTFALNVLAPFALTAYLQGRLRASAPARVVMVASAAHMGHTLDLDDLQSARAYRGYEAYGRSKLALVLISRELARRFAGTGVTVNSLHPGFVHTGFGLNNGGGTAATIRVLGLLFGKSPRGGARTPLWAASSPTLEHVSGEYFSGGHIVTGSAASRDLAVAARLYERCRELTGAPDIPLPQAVPAPS